MFIRENYAFIRESFALIREKYIIDNFAKISPMGFRRYLPSIFFTLPILLYREGKYQEFNDRNSGACFYKEILDR